MYWACAPRPPRPRLRKLITLRRDRFIQIQTQTILWLPKIFRQWLPKIKNRPDSSYSSSQTCLEFLFRPRINTFTIPLKSYTYEVTFVVLREPNFHLLVGHTVLQWSCVCIRAVR